MKPYIPDVCISQCKTLNDDRMMTWSDTRLGRTNVNIGQWLALLIFLCGLIIVSPWCNQHIPMTLCTRVLLAGCSKTPVTNKINHFKRAKSGAECKIVRHIWLIILNGNIMQNTRFLMSLRSAPGFTDITKPNVLHHPMQVENLHLNP